MMAKLRMFSMGTALMAAQITFASESGKAQASRLGVRKAKANAVEPLPDGQLPEKASNPMNVDTMRRIDHWAGVPLCAAATLLVRLRDAFRPRAVSPVRRILFVELSEMGTTILADPAMRKARTELSAELFFVIFERNAGSLDLLGTFPPGNVFTISDKSLFALARDTLGFLRWCWNKDIDTVVDLELFSRFTALLSGLSGAERRVGFHRFYNEG